MAKKQKTYVVTDEQFKAIDRLSKDLMKAVGALDKSIGKYGKAYTKAESDVILARDAEIDPLLKEKDKLAKAHRALTRLNNAALTGLDIDDYLDGVVSTADALITELNAVRNVG